VFGTIVAVALYCGYQIIPFYYYFYELQNQMDALARVADLETDQNIRKKLEYHMKKMQIPADISDLKIVREGSAIRLSLSYKEIFYIRFQGKTHDIHVFPFYAEASARFARRGAPSS
jgi:hypothetical protein